MVHEKHTKLPLAAPQEPVVTQLTKSQIKGIYRLGKAVMTDHPDFPAFESLNPERYINRMIDYMYDDDKQALLFLLSLFSVLPVSVIRLKLKFIDWGSKWKGMAGAAFRMLQIALKGMVFTLYYSDFTEGKVIHEKIGYDAIIIK